jgi:hypothetical protein
MTANTEAARPLDRITRITPILYARLYLRQQVGSERISLTLGGGGLSSVAIGCGGRDQRVVSTGLIILR